MAKKTKEIMTTGSIIPTGFNALRDSGAAFSDEMDGLNAAFDHIKIPIGGATYFEIPGDNPDESETVREFSAVILYHHPMRAYYMEKYTGGSNPPDCGSFDGIMGTGNPGGLCDRCIYDRFGSGDNGAKGCKERRRLYLLREGEVFPVLLSLPTGSLKDFSRYLMRCLPKWGKSNAGIARFSLVKAVNKGGIAYSKAQFRMERTLTEEERALIAPLSYQVKAISRQVGYDVAADEVRPTAAFVADGIAPDIGNVPPVEKVACHECGTVITEKMRQFSEGRYGRPLCTSCQKMNQGAA